MSADAKALTATVPLPEDPAVRAEVEELRAQVDRLATRRMQEADKDTQYFEAAGNERHALPGGELQCLFGRYRRAEV